MQYSVRRLCSDEKCTVTVQINPNNPTAREKMWKWIFVSISTPRSLMQSVRLIDDSLSCNQNHDSLFFYKRKWLWFCWRLVSRRLKYTIIEHSLYCIGVTNCHKGILFLDIFWHNLQTEYNLNTWPHHMSQLRKYWKEVVPRTDPRGTPDNTSYNFESMLWKQTCDNL